MCVHVQERVRERERERGRHMHFSLHCSQIKIRVRMFGKEMVDARTLKLFFEMMHSSLYVQLSAHIDA